MKRYLLYFCLALVIITPKHTIAKENSCDNRYLTLINPVRSRDLWIDRRVDPLKNQYSLIKQYNFSATWLLQYDVLEDEELLLEIKIFDENQEKGVFLEVSQKLADKARVIYPHDIPWYSPKAVFLSAYTQSERKRFIDKLFQDFKMKFDYYPQSVGAWWIDSYSLNYMKEKYDIKAALIVADQKTTDNYGVWGQWWGVPYFSSKANILTPASSKTNKQDVVVLQWAQRDPLLAIGEGPKFSNYSLQANDYIRQGKTTEYFQDLINVYLDCQNPVGQVTIGLETGSDSVIYFEEYSRQLEVLKNMSSIRVVTMNEFYEKFSQVYQDYPREIIIESGDSKWVMTTEKRINDEFNEVIKYYPEVSFNDYFITKKDEFLNRVLPVKIEQQNESLMVPVSLSVIFALGLYSFFRKKMKIWLISTIFLLASFGLIIRSHFEFGWEVYYGPILKPLFLYQAILPFACFFAFAFLNRFKNINLWVLPLTFALDPLIQSVRVSFISEKYYLGFAFDAFRFLGISFSNNFKLELVNTDFPSYLAAGLLKFDYSIIWQNTALTLIIYPLTHIFLGLVLNIGLNKSFKFKKILFSVLTFFLLAHLWMLFNTDPFAVQ